MLRTITNRELTKLQTAAIFQPETYNETDNTIEVVFATESEVERHLWAEHFQEVLLCRTENVRLERLNAGGPVVDTHRKSSIDDQIGVVVRAWVDVSSNECRALIRLTQRQDKKGIVQDIITGIIRNISVGYFVYVYEFDEPLPGQIPVYRAIDWEPIEISFVSVPADYASGSRVTPSTNTVTIIKYNRMAENTTETVTPAPPTERTESPEQQAQNIEQVRNQAATEERHRIAEITRAARVTGLPEAFAQTLIDNGTPLHQARAAIIDEAAKSNPVEPRVHSGVTIGVDEKEKKQRGLESAIMQRAGVVRQELAGDPGEFRGMTLMDVAKECLTTAGHSYRGLTQLEIASRALQMASGARDGGGLATGDFSYVLQNVLNKTLRTMYDLQSKTFTAWTRKSTATDFKQMLRTQLNDVKLSPVQEGGEYSYAKVGDSGEVYKVAKYGKIVNIDWEAIVNDDLSAFSRVPTFLAGAVAQMQSDVVYSILTGSHKMHDGNELFDAANHNNYTSAGTAISVASLGAGRQMMRDQKSPGNNHLNIAPKYLIVGSQNEAPALQYTSQNYIAAKQADINVWTGLLTPIVDARVTGKQWYLSADPMLIDTIEYATLDGQEIFTETKYGFNVDALQYKVRSVFGGKAIEWRSLYKNAGA